MYCIYHFFVHRKSLFFMIEAFRNICLDYRYILERHLFNPSQEMNQKVVLTIMKEHKRKKQRNGVKYSSVSVVVENDIHFFGLNVYSSFLSRTTIHSAPIFERIYSTYI